MYRNTVVKPSNVLGVVSSPVVCYQSGTRAVLPDWAIIPAQNADWAIFHAQSGNTAHDLSSKLQVLVSPIAYFGSYHKEGTETSSLAGLGGIYFPIWEHFSRVVSVKGNPH